MLEQDLKEDEKRDIREQIGRILRDLGNPEPPLLLDDARRLLRLDLQYYSSSDIGLIQELTHRFTLLARKTIPDVGRHLLSALSKSRLCSFWVPESARILLDQDVPPPRQRWIQAHEISHSVIPWHKKYLLGDNLQMVDPTCRAVLEMEANYGAGQLLSLQDRLASEAHDLAFSFPSIKYLAKRYGNSIVSTFWRIVEGRDPAQPVFGIIGVHPRFPNIGRHGGPHPWRHYIGSRAFRTYFSNIGPADVFEIIKRHATNRKTGPVFNAQDILPDANGDHWVFYMECFSTGHDMLTFGHLVRRQVSIVAGLVG